MSPLEEHATMCLLMQRGARCGWNTSPAWNILERLKDEMAPDDRRMAELREKLLGAYIYEPREPEGAGT